VYEELGGNPFFFDTIDKFYSSNDFCQALRMVKGVADGEVESIVSVHTGRV
jgi:hypothetical protein